jgi:HK97 family phage major capsid protein/HK97 family phage prohead protease
MDDAGNVPTTPDSLLAHIQDLHGATQNVEETFAQLQERHSFMHETASPAHFHPDLPRVGHHSAFPTDNLVRAVTERAQVRDVEAGMPTLFGHFARFDQFNLIDSAYEGTFLERIAPHAFDKTIAENRDNMRVLFQHGRDPVVGDKPLAAISALRADKTGPYYEGQLLDTSYVRDILPGLQAGVYGASYRFRVLREDIVQPTEASDHNPDQLPERTIKEAQVMEFGPVTFPADPMATAGVRSLTDWYRDTKSFDATLKELATSKPAELARRIESALPPAPPQGTQEPVRAQEDPVEEERTLRSKEDKVARIEELRSELQTLADEYPGVMPAKAQTRFDDLEAAIEKQDADLRAQEERERKLQKWSQPEERETRRETVTAPNVIVQRDDIYDQAAVYRDARSPEDAAQKFKANAMRSVEGAAFPNSTAPKEDQQASIENLLGSVDTDDAEIARRILTTGSPAYRRAFGKYVKTQGNTHTMTEEERAVMAEGAVGTGGAAIVYDLDPTIVKTSNGAVNPFRRVCRVVSISGTNEWRAVTSGAVVATYELESAVAVDRSPTLTQPAFLAKRAQSLIDFSIELDQDWSQLQSEMAGLIQDSKDTLEATQFATGVGTTVFPQGMVVGFTNTATTGTTTVLAVNDVYKTEEALPPRFRSNAQWFANRFWYNKVRQLDTAGGANLWVPDLRTGIPANETGNTGFNLIGYPANEASGFAATLASTTKEAVLCAPNFYVIVERVGMNIEFIPHFFDATTGYPTGRRLLYAMWRNTARVLDPAGGITLVGV